MPAPSLSLAAIRQPAFLFGPDGRIAEANDLAEALAGRSLAGRTPAAAVGIFDIRAPDGTPLLAAGLPVARALAGKEAVDVPLVVTAADGRTRHILATAAPILNGGEVVGALSIWQDMPDRERVRAEAETVAEELQVQQEELGHQGDELVRTVSDLDRQRQLLDGILGTMPHHVSLWDRNERLVWANERFAAALDRPREALVGRTWREFWREAPGIAPLVEGALRSVGAGTPFTCELEAAGPAGPGWRTVTFLPIFGDQVLVITEEITERKRAEEALRTYAEDLKRSNEDLKRFAYVSSHDLQEPLRSIVSFSQLLERRYRGRLDADADDYIEFIVEGGQRMQTLIQDLLAYSRVNTTRQDLRPTDAEDVMAAVERNLDAPLREAGAIITRDPMAVVLADPLQIEQVFMNLVSNAIKFRRTDVPLQIHIGARRIYGFWEFSVADNGIGIAPEYFERIFVIFQRLHTKEAYPGTGIGLAIVKRIIDRHGGKIWVESVPGEGSTFIFTLPAA